MLSSLQKKKKMYYTSSLLPAKPLTMVEDCQLLNERHVQAHRTACVDSYVQAEM